MTRALLLPTLAGLVLGGSLPAAQPQWQDTIRNLRHPKAEVRLDAVERLGRARYIPAAEPVAALLTDPDDRVQLAALDAELSFFAIDPPRGGRGDAHSPAQRAFEIGPVLRVAAPAPAAVIDQLIAAMRDDNALVRFDAVHLVGFIGEPPLAPAEARALAGELDHYDPVIRMATARVLGRLRAREGADGLLTALDDSNALVRAYAIDALGRLREPRALGTLHDLLVQPKRKLVAEARLAIGRLAPEEDRATFREWLTNRDSDVRRAALEGLARLADTESKPAIEAAAKTDKNPSVRLAAAFALQRIGETQSHIIASLAGADDVGLQAREYLFELGHDALPGVQAALQAVTDTNTRIDLLQMAGYLGTADDVRVVEPFLTNRDARVVRAATEAIVRLRQANPAP
jgi:HEAT repeat protein